MIYFSNGGKNEKFEDIPRAYFRKLRKTFTVDLSANGIRIITYEDKIMSKYALISLFIKEQIYILCSVVRTNYDDISKSYQTAMQFIDLNNNKWQYINEFVYSQLETHKIT
ncbi:PilZ domain-containing protein [Clostridium sp. DJ247]|uniref:PilZ domain-containing protein n=1 Tax=Clostridium sp. DJ247 TaxID=2726188 RepID=UPI00162ABAAE|nr:PilZ domain-containing protein [Clostridium sp. DJ247]MBC2581304.1 PilZ domain-containing protein [Clostridium sp. DJ247]